MYFKYLLMGFTISFFAHGIIFFPKDLSQSSAKINLSKSRGFKIVVKERSKQASRKKAVHKKLLKNGKKQTNQSSKVSFDAIEKGKIAPKYPYKSRIYGEAGEVTLMAHISKTGSVDNVTLLKSSGFKRLDNEAIRTLRAASFFPAKKRGKSISSKKEMSFNFKLN